MNTQTKTLLHLNLISGIGPATIERLVQSMFNIKGINLDFLDSIYDIDIKDLIKISRLPESICQKIFDGLKDFSILDAELNLLEKHKINIVSLYDNNYPLLLKNTYLPPVILYVKGADLAKEGLNIALVGSRKANSYGYKVVNLLVPELVSNGLTIVSGGALGIDTLAHQATLDSGGKTIAVIGSGLLKPYPAINNKLFDSIVENNGSIVSPFPLNFAAAPGNFPARNRIISGFSQACVIVQAAIKSGALITGHYAMEQGREVFAVPGQIDDELSAGCHSLISQGANILTSTQDILSFFNKSDLLVNSQAKSQQMAFIKEINKNNNLIKVSNIQDTIENKIINYCQTAVTFDELLQNFSLDFDKLQEILLLLQINGQIEQDFAGLYKRV